MTPTEKLKQLEAYLKTAPRHEKPILEANRRELIKEIAKERGGDRFRDMFGNSEFDFIRDFFGGRGKK